MLQLNELVNDIQNRLNNSGSTLEFVIFTDMGKYEKARKKDYIRNIKEMGRRGNKEKRRVRESVSGCGDKRRVNEQVFACVIDYKQC